jgi:hypothetical protein
MDRAAGIPAQIMALRRGPGDGSVQPPVGQDRAERVQPRAAVRPGCRQERDREPRHGRRARLAAVQGGDARPQHPGHFGDVRRAGLELLPGGHGSQSCREMHERARPAGGPAVASPGARRRRAPYDPLAAIWRPVGLRAKRSPSWTALIRPMLRVRCGWCLTEVTGVWSSTRALPRMRGLGTAG